MNRDTLILGGLLALALVGVILLAALGEPVPELLEYVAIALAGALTGASLPVRARENSRSTP